MLLSAAWSRDQPARVEPAALQHETVDHTMKNGAVVVTRTNVVEKIFHRLGGLVGIEFELDRAQIGVEYDCHENPW